MLSVGTAVNSTSNPGVKSLAGATRAPRVLFVTHAHEKGGAELFLSDILSAGPPQWSAAVLSRGPLWDELKVAGRLVDQQAIDLRIIRRNSSGLISIARGALAGVRAGLRIAAQGRDHDVVCANSLKALFICSVAAAVSRKPLVWILHDIIDGPSYSAPLRWGSILLSRLFAHRVIANSEATERSFIRSSGDPAKVRVIYNGFRAAAGQDHVAAAAAVRREFRFDEGPVVGVFSRLAPWKGQALLLRSLATLPGIQALIVGGPLFGETAYERELLRLSADLGLAERVRFAGHRTEVASLMAGVDVIVHTSTEPEPFGRVIVEGQLSGRPVIASAGGGVAEIIRDGETGLLVPPGDPAALAQAIGRLARDAEFRSTLGVRGKRYASARFRLEDTVEELRALIAELG